MGGTASGPNLRRRRILRIAVAATWAVVAALAVLLGVRFVIENRRAHAYSDAIAAAERSLREGELPAADQALSRAGANARTATQWLSILKRVRLAAERSPDGFALLDGFALRAARQFPGNESIWAIAVWAELRKGDTRRAAENASRNLESGRFESLRLEALFRAGEVRSAAESLSDSGLQLLAGAALTRDPDLFRRAGALTGDRRFYVDMALLEASTSVTDALKAVDRYSLGSAAPAVAALLAYDAGDFEATRGYLGLMPPEQALGPQMVMLQADMLMAGRKFDQARAMYQDLLRRHPDVPPVVYQNLAYLSVLPDLAGGGSDSLMPATPPQQTPRGGQPALPRHLASQGVRDAEQYLALGMRRFPDDAELVQAMAALRVVEGQRDRALSLVNGFVAAHPDDRSVRLYRIIHLSENEPAERTTAELWKLVNSSSDSPAGQLLANRLLVLRDFNALRSLLGRYPKTGSPLWVDFYRAILPATLDETGAARDAFSTIWSESGSWEAAYDTALTYLAEGSIQPAMRELDRAEQAADGAAQRGDWSGVPGVVPEPADLALLEYRRAEVMAAEAQTARALDAARRAASLDPANSDIGLLLQKLEAAIQR